MTGPHSSVHTEGDRTQRTQAYRREGRRSHTRVQPHGRARLGRGPGELPDRLHHVVQHRFCEPGPDADPEGAFGDAIGVIEGAVDTVGDVEVGGLAQ